MTLYYIIPAETLTTLEATYGVGIKCSDFQYVGPRLISGGAHAGSSGVNTDFFNDVDTCCCKAVLKPIFESLEQAELTVSTVTNEDGTTEQLYEG